MGWVTCLGAIASLRFPPPLRGSVAASLAQATHHAMTGVVRTPNLRSLVGMSCLCWSLVRSHGPEAATFHPLASLQTFGVSGWSVLSNADRLWAQSLLIFLHSYPRTWRVNEAWHVVLCVERSLLFGHSLCCSRVGFFGRTYLDRRLISLNSKGCVSLIHM
jgi:hypothetical protein